MEQVRPWEYKLCLLASVPSLFITCSMMLQVHHRHLSSELFHLVVLLLIHKDIRLELWDDKYFTVFYMYIKPTFKAQRIVKGEEGIHNYA